MVKFLRPGPSCGDSFAVTLPWASLEVVARQVGVEALGVCGVERRAALTGGRFAAPSAGAAPAPKADGDGDPRQQDREAWDEPGCEVEARLRRLGEDRGAILGDEVVLDLVLGLALGDLAADEGALAVGLRRLREVECRAADRAHHLVLYVGQGGPGLRR